MLEVSSMLYFIIFYIVLLVLTPMKILRLPLGKKQTADSIWKAVMVSYTVCISLVYVLGLLHIYNRFTLAAGLILTAVIYGLVKKVKYREKIMQGFHVLALLGGGQYRMEIFIKDWMCRCRRRCKEGAKGILREITFGKAVYFVFCLAAFLLLMVRRLTPFLGSYAYMTSDMYVHHEWINYMEMGDIFYDGIYPFGMHNMLSALHLLTGLHMNYIFRYYGALNCILTAAGAVYFLCRIGSTRAAVLIYLMLYGVTDFAGNHFAYRMAFTLPQECAMPFLFICLLYLGKYLENKKKEDGVYFALAASLIVSTHFFTAIFAAALCGSLGLAYFVKIWKEKMMLPLLKFLLLVVCISMVPFLAGKLEGKYWQGSMSWALGVMQKSQHEEDELQLEEVRGEEEEDLEAQAEAEAEKKSIPRMFLDMMVEKMYAFWGYVFWAGMCFDGCFLLLGRKRWKNWQNKQFFAVWLTLLFCMVLTGYWILGIPQLMKEERVSMFVGYFGPVLFAFPVECLAAYFGKWGKTMAEVAGGVAAVLCFYVTYGLGNIPFQTYFYLETSTAAKACVKIAGEYEKNTWTVVSPVEELSLVREMGFHYELWEFILGMERYDEKRYLEIPTKNVFFILEKNPVPYNVTRIMGRQYHDAPINREDAAVVVTKEMLGISENGSMKYYNIYENRRALEAKLEAWIETYASLFPEQMSVYMESEDCVVYQLKQNEYAWNNLAVDYGYNVISDEEYDRMLEEKQSLRREREAG
jgi:hypothetical protein